MGNALDFSRHRKNNYKLDEQEYAEKNFQWENMTCDREQIVCQYLGGRELLTGNTGLLRKISQEEKYYKYNWERLGFYTLGKWN